MIMRGTLASNSNLNGVTTVGMWQLNGNNTYTNAPSGIRYGHLTVVRCGPSMSFVEQRVTHMSDYVGYYLRSSTNGGDTWTDWVFVGGRNVLTANGQSGTVPSSGGNINICSIELEAGRGYIATWTFYGYSTSSSTERAVRIIDSDNNVWCVSSAPQGYVVSNAFLIQGASAKRNYHIQLLSAPANVGYSTSVIRAAMIC